VVDDDPDAAEALAELLSMNGHDVRTVTGADQALRLFPSLQPQVAVLDIGLPVMDGYELQARMSKLPGGAECMYVALTGYGMKREQEQSRRAGFRAHLVKPVDLDQLVRLIADSMEAAGSVDPQQAAGPPAGSR
jgi:CheY-like chemotaxis protein